MTTVILHAVFDLTLMSIPVFLIEGPGSTINQALVIAAGLVPLAIVLARRYREGRWFDACPRPCATRLAAPGCAGGRRAVRGRAAAGAWTARVQRALPLLGLAGLIAIGFIGRLQHDTPPLLIDRAQAEATADAARRAARDEAGRRVEALFGHRGSSPTTPRAAQWHQFVWREAGRDAYEKLIGNWLAPPLWEVRYARFDGGDVADRAEEWRVTVTGDGTVRQVRHALPEKRPGAMLSREQARTLAQQEIRQHFGLDPATLREVVRRGASATGARRLAIHLRRSGCRGRARAGRHA